MEIKVTKDDKGKTGIFKIVLDKFISGYQIEYTKLLIKDKIYYSFALEWFGDKFIDLESKLGEVKGAVD